MTYGVYKLWFCYNDEYYDTDRKLANCIGSFSSLSEAESQKIAADVLALRQMINYDCIRDLRGFMPKGREAENKVAKQLVDYARSIGWNEQVREQHFYDSEETYFELSIPETATDEQLKKILEISGAYFHTIIQQQTVETAAYIQFNRAFWGAKPYKALKDDEIIADRSPYVNNVKFKGRYLIHKPEKGRKSAKIKDADQAYKIAIKQIMPLLKKYYLHTFLNKRKVIEYSQSPTLFLQFLRNCKTIQLEETNVAEDNLKAIKEETKSAKFKGSIKKGDVYYKIVLPEFSDRSFNELKVFFQMLEERPFDFHVIHTSVNGEEVRQFYMEHGVF